MKAFGLHILVTVSSVFFTMIYAMDERSMVPVRQVPDRKVPISFIRAYINRTLLYALQHETFFVHKSLAAQMRIPKVNVARGDITDKHKILMRSVPQNIQYLQVEECVMQNRYDSEDDYNSIHIDFACHEEPIFTQEYFEHIRRMPEGAPLCFCNLLCGVGILGIVFLVTFFR